MSEDAPVFLVNPYSDPVVVRVNGRANYMNSGPLRDFFSTLQEQGRSHIVIDFRNCISVDSTFLGIVAGAALELTELDPPGELKLTALGPRNMELIRNLGLHRIATVEDTPPEETPSTDREVALAQDKTDREERTRMIVDAHQNLVQCDESNAERFQDVLTFLRKRSDVWDRNE